AVLEEPAAARGRLMGAFNGIARAGSMVSVALGGFLVDQLGYAPTMLCFGLATLAGVPFAFVVPPRAYVNPAGTGRSAEPTGGRLRLLVGDTAPLRALYVAGFLTYFIGSGLVTSTLSLLVRERLEGAGGAATLAGLLLAGRFLSDLVLGLPLGHLSDRLGRRRTAPVLCAIAGLLLGVLAGADALALLAG